MKNFYTYSFMFIFFASCTSYNKIITIDDHFKNEKSIRLIQELEGYSDEKRNGLFNGVDYWVTLKTLYIKPELENGHIIAELTVKSNVRPEELDSVIFIEANGNKFRFHSTGYASRHYIHNSSSTQITTSSEKEKDEKDKDKEKETTATSTLTTTTQQTSQIMKSTIEISSDTWGKLTNLEKVMIRFYIETEGVNAEFSARDRKKLARFFKEVIDFEESNIMGSS